MFDYLRFRTVTSLTLKFKKGWEKSNNKGDKIGLFVKFIKGANPIKVDLYKADTSINKLLVTRYSLLVEEQGSLLGVGIRIFIRGRDKGT